LSDDERVCAEVFVEVRDDTRMASPMTRSDRAHLDDEPVQQFDALVLEDSEVGDAVVLVDRERARR
jgi:hypothetical protein